MQEYLERFRREAEVCRKLGHPNIVNMIDSGMVGGISYIAMEYVDGQTLKELITESGRISQDEAVRYALHPDLCFTALVPDFELSTHLARSVLPKEIPFADAVFNVSRAAVLLKALENGDRELISTALVDRLHQPYRSKLIRGYDQLRKLALDNGALAFCISGAGPTLLCLSHRPDLHQVLQPLLTGLDDHWRAIPLPVDPNGVDVKLG